MTASERYLQAVFQCHHQPDGACVDCTIAGFIAHAEAVRAEAAKTLEITQMRIPEPFRKCDFYPDEDGEGWVSVPRQIQDILRTAANRIRAIEVS